MAIPGHCVQIGADKWSDPVIEIWDADKVAWREPATSEERIDALMALVLKIGVSLRGIGGQ